MDKKELELILEIKENIPHFFIGDEQRITQAVTNLLSNAVKFSFEKGCIRLDISQVLLNEKENGMCELQFEITDNGIGIAADKQETIFHPYEQADTGIAGKYGGIGLGLVITKNIIELMDGKIWVISNHGKGAKFIFTIKLPVYKQESDPQNETGYIGDITIKDINKKFKGKNILIVEDIEINNEVIVSILEGSGLNIDSAVNGRDALDMIFIHPEKYDMIFMDMQMPVMDGLEATREIREFEKHHADKNPGKPCKVVPIIAMTANVFQQDIQKCLEAGMNEHVGKPIDIARIYQILCDYL